MSLSVDRKLWVALSGAFLTLFLVVHLAGNLALFLPPEQARPVFNAYSAWLSQLVLVRVVAIGVYASFVVHAVVSLALAWRNRRARGPVRYQYDPAARSSPWFARRMGALGVVLLVFLVVHLRTFWATYHWGGLPLDPAGHKDLYGLTVEAFARPGYVLFYVASMIALAFHLLHGTVSATRTLGLYHRRVGRWAGRVGVLLSVTLGAGFAALPVWVHLTTGGLS